jgi:hypothetical protein
MTYLSIILNLIFVIHIGTNNKHINYLNNTPTISTDGTIIVPISIDTCLNETITYESKPSELQDANKLARQRDSIINLDDVIKTTPIANINDSLTTTETSIDTTLHTLITNKELLLFCKYIKTQSNDPFSTKGYKDQIYVIQVMLNRLYKNNVTWTQYYNNPKVNCSQTIKRMKSKRLNISFNIEKSSTDFQTHCNVMDVLNGRIEPEFVLPKNILYFHSHNRPYLSKNGMWSKKNHYCTVIHKFFK